MSLIQEALKRQDDEAATRQAAGAPPLQVAPRARPSATGIAPPPMPEPPRSRAPAVVFGILLILLLGAGTLAALMLMKRNLAGPVAHPGDPATPPDPIPLAVVAPPAQTGTLAILPPAAVPVEGTSRPPSITIATVATSPAPAVAVAPTHTQPPIPPPAAVPPVSPASPAVASSPPRPPGTPPEAVTPTVAADRPLSTENWPALQIKGCMVSRKGSSAIINGRIVSVGEHINGVRLVGVTASHAELEYRGVTVKLRNNSSTQ